MLQYETLEYILCMHCSILKLLKCVVCVEIGFLGQVTDQHVIFCMHMHDMYKNLMIPQPVGFNMLKYFFVSVEQVTEKI